MSDAIGSDTSTGAWVVQESGFDRERANFYETLFTVGNGRLGTRGSLEEGHLGAAVGHVPGRRLRRSRRPGDRPGQLPGLGGHRGRRRRGPPRRGHLHGRHPSPLLGPAGRASDPDHRLRGRRGPADTAGDDALREHGRPQGLRAAGRGHSREPCGGDPGRDRHRRGPPQPRTASALSGRHGVPSGDPVGEMGPRPPSGGVVPVRRGRGPLPRDAHDRHRYRPRVRRRDDLRAATAAAHGAAAQWADHRGDRARRCPGRDAADGQAGRHLHLTRPGRCRHRDPARPVPGRARRTPRGRVRRRRRREPRGVGAPVGRVRLRGRRQCRLHPRPAVLPVSPDDRGEPGGSDGQHRGERAGGGALPGSRVLGHRDLPAPLLHPHPARHRQGAAALPPPHPGRRTGELPRVRHRWGALRLGVRRHRSGGMPEVHRGRRQPVLDP